MTFTKEELIGFNELMLGRGVPSTEDGIGYNKADYGACATYFYGLSDAQYADLAKRLVKYCNTQLNLDKEIMKETAKQFAEIARGVDRSKGISLDVREDGVMIGFRFNMDYIDVIKKQPIRRYDGVTKNWIIPKENIFKVLEDLGKIGADVTNAIEYAKSKINLISKKLPDVIAVENGEETILKFHYNKEIVEEIKKIDKTKRKWNADNKFWTISSDCMDILKERLSNTVKFIYVQ